MRGVRAWLIRWQHQAGNPGDVADDGEVVAVLPTHWSELRVRDILERLHSERTSSPAELVRWRAANAAPDRPQPMFQMHGVPVSGAGLIVGHNPVLLARQVEALRVIDEETLEWIERRPWHRPAFCRALGVPNCELADDEEPEGHIIRWARRR